MKPIRVLVTGAGSGVGQGIIKSLRASTLPTRIIAVDISPFNSALYRSDASFLIPKVEDAGALKKIIEKIKRAHIDVVMIGSEFDLEFFAANKIKIEKETGALVVASPLETVHLSNDKWLTVDFLQKHNLPYAPAFVPKEFKGALKIASEWGYPFILKTRRGTSSRHVHVINDKRELSLFYPGVPFPMLQKLINIPTTNLSHEYTCSVFKCIDGTIVGPFTARRTLRDGSSWIVEVKSFKKLHPLLRSIGAQLPAMGSLNVQLMIGENGPIPFEFNARFSGTTAVRSHFGFNEPEMAIRSYLLGEKILNPVIRTGIAFRYLEEVFLENASAKDLETHFAKGIVRQWF